MKPEIDWIRVHSQNDLYQVILALKESRKKRNELKEFFVEGTQSIKQALRSSRFGFRKIIFADFDKLSDWGREMVKSGTFEEIIQMDNPYFNQLSDRNDPSELFITLSYSRTTLTEQKPGPDALIVIMDRPSDHGNLGSLIRTANGFGADLVITHGHCVDLFDSKVIRSSLGAVFHTPVVHEESFKVLEAWLNQQKERIGLTVVGTDSTGEKSLAETELKTPIALVLGNEARGMSVNIKSITDIMLRIPMEGNVNSLNVACAGSILLWSVYKNRN